MPTDTLALVSGSCDATGHPTQCQEPAPGSIQDADAKTPITVDGTPLADHGDRLHFDSHAHAYSSMKGCYDMQSHDLVPDQTPPITVDGRPVMRVGDHTTDPGSGGTAEIVGSGGNSALTHTS